MALVFTYCAGNNCYPNSVIVSEQDTQETENSDMYNKSKFAGTVAKYLSNGKIVVVPNPNRYITKKNSNELLSSIARRTNAKFAIVCLYDDLSQVNEYYKKYTLMTVAEFTNSNFNKFEKSTRPEQYTAGINASINDGCLRTGHITTCFGINSEQEANMNTVIDNILKQQQIFKGIGIKITTSTNNSNSKESGSVIYVPDLLQVFQDNAISVERPHITCSTTIKAVLSTQIILMFEKGVYEFMLSDIDKTTKQTLHIKISEDGEKDIKLDSYYSYLLENVR